MTQELRRICAISCYRNVIHLRNFIEGGQTNQTTLLIASLADYFPLPSEGARGEAFPSLWEGWGGYKNSGECTFLRWLPA